MKLKRAGIITKIVIFALIVYAAVSLIKMQSQIDAALAEKEVKEQQVTEKETLTAELKYAIEHSDDPEMIAEAARNDLGYVAQGEKVFIGTGN